MIWAGRRAHHLCPECLRAGKNCRAHLFNVGRCAAIQMGESVMNGGNCSSLCPVSRRRQKPLLPQQTMPLCGRQLTAARTSSALCNHQSTHQALGPPPVAPSPSGRPTLAPKAGWGKAGRSTSPETKGQAYGCTSPASPAQAAFCGQRFSCWRQCLPPWAVTVAAGQGRGGGINNSDTKEKGGWRVECWRPQPHRGPGRCGYRGGPAGCLKGQPLPPPSATVALRFSLGHRLHYKLGVCTSLGLVPACFDKGQ